MLKILSYNIFYKTMVTINNNPLHPKCGPVKDGITICLKNVSRFIERNGPYDFVGLQEASNWQLIQKITPTLRRMVAIINVIDLNILVTFYDPSYRLDATHNQIMGYMADANRPFTILFFESNLCIINLHAGHNNDIFRFDQHLKNILINKEETVHPYLSKLKTYDIVMMGDFNGNIDENFAILTDPYFQIPGGRKMHGINHISTCCNYWLIPFYSSSRAFDQVISTISKIQNRVYPVHNASDHAPIIAWLTWPHARRNVPRKAVNRYHRFHHKHRPHHRHRFHQKKGGGKINIGYDFDGVLHLDVEEADEIGQRHAVNDEGPYRPFNKMVQHLRKRLDSGYPVFIITSRTQNPISVKAVQTHLAQCGLSNVPVYYASGGSKVDLLRQLEINQYFDDSCVQIEEIYYVKQRGQLPHLSELYFVVPETEKVILVTERNFEQICPSIFQRDGKTIDEHLQRIRGMLMKGYRLRDSKVDGLLFQLNQAIYLDAGWQVVEDLQWRIIRLIDARLAGL